MAKGIVTFRLDGVQDAINRLAKVGGQVAEDVEDELAAGANDIRASAARNISSQIQNTTRQMLGGLYVAQVGPLRFEVGNNVYYAPYIEFGTRGKVSVPKEMQAIAAEIQKRPSRGKFPDMVDAIYKWAVKKGLWSKDDADGKWRAVRMASSIYRNGIAPQPFLYPAYIENRSKIIERIKKVVEKPR